MLAAVSPFLGGDSAPGQNEANRPTPTKPGPIPMYQFRKRQGCFTPGGGSYADNTPLDSVGRATGGYACINPATYKGGSTTQAEKPNGYIEGEDNRSHLVAREHGGGRTVENIVPMYEQANQNNNWGMRRFENEINDQLKNGRTVYEAVRPVYGNAIRPVGVDMYMVTNGGYGCHLWVPNARTGASSTGITCG
ncbi:MAG: DNA/RNA non-specific endonuclease [Mycobacterium sp.]|nr:DNA/RNA non-specific endonuclease [Mycobacterium sp.]